MAENNEKPSFTQSLFNDENLQIAKLKEQLPDTTMIYVTHDQVEAMTLADRIVVLRDGRVDDTFGKRRIRRTGYIFVIIVTRTCC